MEIEGNEFRQNQTTDNLKSVEKFKTRVSKNKRYYCFLVDLRNLNSRIGIINLFMS